MDALVAELDDRVDHLLLLGLEDALLAAALDEDLQLLGAHHALRLVARAEHPGHAVVIAVRTRTSGPRTRSRTTMKPLRRSANASVWASARLLGTSSPKTIVNRLRMQGHDDQREGPGRRAEDRQPEPGEQVSRLAVRLTAA